MDSWKTTGTLTQARTTHTATLLPNGNILLCGGSNQTEGLLNTAELFTPRSGSCSATSSMFYGRALHTASLLPNGQVIVVGGTNTRNTEIYDPESGQWFATGPLNVTRFNFHAMAMMNNGRILVAGGNVFPQPISAAEEYDPVTQVWSIVGSMQNARSGFTMTTLLDGRVLAVGGIDHTGFLDSAELYDPQTQTWSAVNGLFYKRWQHAATRLVDGRVLVAGGTTTGDVPLNTCELFDPPSGNWLPVGTLHVARGGPKAALMHDGRVLVTGGFAAQQVSTGGGFPPLDSAEIFDPEKQAWTLAPSMSTPRSSHTETRLARRPGEGVNLVEGNEVFVAGGEGQGLTGDELNATEVYEIGQPVRVPSRL
jgi:N-acetylneuraminic acid mutarotase